MNLLGFTPFTQFHSIISLVGIVSGFVVLRGMFHSKRLVGWTAAFLLSTLLTSVTGFFFRPFLLGPSNIIGIISVVLLAVAIYAWYGRHLAGHWRRAYVIPAVASLYFNVFVLVVQLFRKVPALNALAPTQSEPPFAVTQLIVLIVFIWWGRKAVKQFHPAQ
jgi:hypothetical protein